VVITGSGFFEQPTGGTNKVTLVKFGNSSVASPAASSDGQMTVTSPPFTAGDPATVDVRVTTADGGTSAISNADHFTYTFSTPTVTSVVPADGPSAGGTTGIVVTGTGFTGATGATAVTFGATNAAAYVVNSDTQLTATSPASAAGVVDVHVTAPGGTSAANTGGCPASPCDRFTFVAAPTVSSVTPSSGPTAGGTPVTCPPSVSAPLPLQPSR
jgi:hypothetical protein